MGTGQSDRPSWDRLFEAAAAQEGYFTTQQAALAGYSPQLLAHHVRAGKLTRVRRGIYRLVHFPPGEHEDLIAVWLWSEREGVVSHHTALALHSLSDILPSRVHLTLPAGWHHRRLRVPPGVLVHYGDIRASERVWVGALPVTSVRRTLADCAAAHLSPELLDQALRQALARGLIVQSDVQEVVRALQPFGSNAV
jgi:predicted transcriptional regulator of viral defense system